MTLFQYDDSSKLYREGDIVDYLLEIFVETLTEFGAVFFLLSKRNRKVNSALENINIEI